MDAMDNPDAGAGAGDGDGASTGPGPGPDTTILPTRSLPPAPPPGPITPAVDQPTYTFIDHDNDLRSKKIRSASSRKAIRSHVMRDVRRRERLAGLKRGTKRDTQEKRPQPKVASKPVEESSTERTSACWTTSPSSSSTSSFSTIEEIEAGNELVRSQPTWHQQEDQHQQLQRQQLMTGSADSSTTSTPISIAQPNTTTWFPAPQRPMKSVDCIPTVVADLIYYWNNAFVPLIFPNEKNAIQRAGMGHMVQSVFSDSGCFFAVMYMCAAHRAILTGRLVESDDGVNDSELRDPDYYMLKDRCIHEMKTKLRDPAQKASNEALQLAVSLLTGALIVGLFSEVRMHLRGLKELVEMRGGITFGTIRCSSVLASILAVDVKAASGLMTKPLFPLSWASNPVPSHAHLRLKLSDYPSHLGRFGMALYANPLISAPLQRIIHVLCEVASYCETSHFNAAALLPEDYTFFRLLSCEAEHQLLSYKYVQFERARLLHPGTTFELNPMEALVRTATIAFINDFLIISPPSSGLGRALTRHMKKSVDICFDLLPHFPSENVTLVIWALFVGARGSLGRAEHPWFIERLVSLVMFCGWDDWDEVVDHLSGYVFVHHVQSHSWRIVWDQVSKRLPPKKKQGRC